MQQVRLERVRRHLNEERFYEILLSTDMFNAWIVECKWGRIGSEGDARRLSFGSHSAACTEVRKICRVKLARGYQVVADPECLMPIDLLPPEDSQTRLLRSAEALERLLQDVPAHRDGRLGRIVASLASACRLRRRNGERHMPPGQRRAEWLIDDTESRIRSRIFQLLDELVSGVLTEDDEHAVFRMVQEASTSGLGSTTIRLIPRTRHALLDQQVVEALAPNRGLAEFGLDAADHGIRFLGQLVQLDLTEIIELTQGNLAVVRRLEDWLRELGLPLGGRAPGWYPPPRSALRA